MKALTAEGVAARREKGDLPVALLSSLLMGSLIGGVSAVMGSADGTISVGRQHSIAASVMAACGRDIRSSRRASGEKVKRKKKKKRKQIQENGLPGKLPPVTCSWPLFPEVDFDNAEVIGFHIRNSDLSDGL
jgi:hypothetical protein